VRLLRFCLPWGLVSGLHWGLAVESFPKLASSLVRPGESKRAVAPDFGVLLQPVAGESQRRVFPIRPAS